jgi:hypothetical protein
VTVRVGVQGIDIGYRRSVGPQLVPTVAAQHVHAVTLDGRHHPALVIDGERGDRQAGRQSRDR